MLEETLKRCIAKWICRDRIKFFRERKEFWEKQERMAIENGVGPFHEKIVLIRKLRLTYEDIIDTLSSATIAEKSVQEDCMLKAKDCAKIESAIKEWISATKKQSGI